MPRKRSNRGSGRDRRRTSLTPRVAPDPFDDNWLTQYSERQWSRYVDLTKYEDRRRWHPSQIGREPIGPAPKALVGRPRIVIVPEGHRLARLAPYGGRVPLHKILQRESRTRRRFLDDWTEKTYTDKYNNAYQAYRPDHLSRRVGFQHPWQVMICIRRKRRREVMHALKHAGRVGQRKPRRNEYSEVRC